jgi:hypothetical protein
MRRWERWSFNITALLVSATGFTYFWMKYLLVNEDPFAVVNHPWEAAMLSLHVLASPPFILLFGTILNSHVMKKLGATRIPNRTSGLISFGTFAAMVASGYVLQVATSESIRQALVIAHVGSGAVFTIAYAIHLIISVRLVRSRPARPAVQAVA